MSLTALYKQSDIIFETISIAYINGHLFGITHS